MYAYHVMMCIIKYVLNTSNYGPKISPIFGIFYVSLIMTVQKTKTQDKACQDSFYVHEVPISWRSKEP